VGRRDKPGDDEEADTCVLLQRVETARRISVIRSDQVFLLGRVFSSMRGLILDPLIG
jgi:hypothetical protein